VANNPSGRCASGLAKSNIDVKSPQTARRHAEIFGSATPKRRSRKRRIEVWSNTSEHTHPPRVQGDTTSSGTRAPRPTGSPPLISPSSATPQ
jgi:hypothetical protein